VKRLRAGVPGIVLRTSVIVGYPGESAAAFRELFDFVKRARFERLGAFAYSAEPGTAAFDLKPRPSQKTVARRVERLMEFQRSVIEERNKYLVGEGADVIVDACFESDASFSGSGGWGRTKGDAPDIDCTVEIRGEVKTGSITRVRFTGYKGYDLIAEPAGRSGKVKRSKVRP